MLDFLLFGLTLLGVAALHRHALWIALGGLAAVSLLKAVQGFDFGTHLGHEWRLIANLAGLLVGFAILANHFERSHLPQWMTAVLPPGKLGALLLLGLVFVLSGVLDNIAAALVGATAARILFAGRVHIGYLAAIVAAANAGGAGSVIGDTTTTMIWLAGGSPLQVLPAYVGAAAALAFFGWSASSQQTAQQPMVRADASATHLDLAQLVPVVLMLIGAIAANVLLDFPALGVWGGLLLGALVRTPDWSVVPGAAKGALFLLSLVLTASMMPVDQLPAASWPTALGLGVTSSFFDNIPLTKLAIAQNGYDWGFLAYAVGYGGSMLWFGSSAGVAVGGVFPEAKNALAWLRHGWHVLVGYFVGYFVMLLVLGWHPVQLPSASGH